MTTTDLAIAVCEKLGPRARKPCPACTGSGNIPNRADPRSVVTCDLCGGLGWLPALLLPEEPCRGDPVIDHLPDCAGGCGGSGVIQRVDEGLLRELLEEAGHTVEYSSRLWFIWKEFSYENQGSANALLEAAAKALGVEVLSDAAKQHEQRRRRDARDRG